MTFDVAAPSAQPTLQAILDSIDHAVFALDAQLRIVYSNAAAQQFAPDLASQQRLLAGVPIDDVLRGETARLVNGLRRVAEGALARFSFRSTLAQSGRTVEFLCTRIRDGASGVVLLVEDISDHVRVQRQLEGLQRLSRTLARIDRLHDAVAALVHQLPPLIEAEVGALYTIDDDEMLHVLGSWGADPAALVERAGEHEPLVLLALRAREAIVVPCATDLPRRDGASFPSLRAAIAAPLLGSGRPRGVLLLGYTRPVGPFSPDYLAMVEAICDEIATTFERADLVERLAREALTDPLTGIANRRAFEDTLRRQHARAQRAAQAYGVVMADIDGMKAINDQFGHAAGDAALRMVGRALVGATRASDFVARIGGDEFAVLLPDADRRGVRLVIHRLRQTLPLALTWKGHRIAVWFSVGGAAFPADGASAETLLHRADRALYRAKRRQKRRLDNEPD
ncbi:MAG: diguanylate cyclase [Chloroflexota bacterium]|nr:diguanylate cyclase [Dehalococcoidia bacterium]MDW8252819.1 diguanylate cyclase [Chloroflexota bacterium]